MDQQPVNPVQPTVAPKKKYNKLGMLWIVVPIVSLPIILMIYAISTFIMVQSASEPGASVIGFRIFGIILSLLGVLDVLALIIGIPLGIYYLIKGANQPD